MIRIFFKLPVIYLLSIILLTLLILNVDYPKVGRDYMEFIPRLLDSHLFYLHNGLHIQWWTPSFGGGLPSYPNPQQIQFSLPQWFLFLLNPWMAINLAVIIFVSIGYLSTFLLFYKQLGFSRDQAAMGATLFSVTGFYIEHICVGHVGFLTYPLLPLVLIVLLNTRFPFWINAFSLAIICAILLYSAGFIPFILFLFAVPMVLLLLMVMPSSPVPKFSRLASIILPGGGIALLLCGSKIIATAQFMHYFPRVIEDAYNVGMARACIGMLAQLFCVPLLIFFDSILVDNIIRYYTGALYSLWELDIGLPPVVLVIFVSSLMLTRRFVHFFVKHIFRDKFIPFIVLLGWVWISIEFSLARGVVYGLLKDVAFMKSLHVNVRFTAIFILPLIITAMYLYRPLLARIPPNITRRIKITTVLTVLTIILYSQYIQVPLRFNYLVFDVRQSLHDWTGMNANHHRYQVKHLAPVYDFQVFSANASSQYPYEPLFGYRGETFTPQTHVGAVTDSENGFFNLTHPASLVFPEENGLTLFQRIPITDAENFEKFIHYRQPDWNVSTLQVLADYVSCVSFLGGLVIVGGYATHRGMNKKKLKDSVMTRTRHTPGRIQK